MSYIEYQRALAILTRTPSHFNQQEALGYDALDLTDDELENLTILQKNPYVQKYSRTMFAIRQKTAYRSLFMTRKLMEEEILDHYYQKFDTKFIHINSYDLGYGFLKYLNENFEDKDNHLLTEVLQFEKAQARFRRYGSAAWEPPFKQGILAHDNFEALELSFDIPAYEKDLRRQKSFAKIVARRFSTLMLRNRDQPGYKLYEIDDATLEFLHRARRNDRAVTPPPAMGDLVALGLVSKT